jgi:hypothetical protein
MAGDIGTTKALGLSMLGAAAASAQRQQASARQPTQVEGSPAIATLVPAGFVAAPKVGIEYCKCGSA